MRLVVCPARRLKEAFDLVEAADLLCLISPDAVEPERHPNESRRLVLRFNDIDGPRPGLIAPDPGAVADLLEFAAEAPNLVVHCYAGVSRSTAAAYAIACQAAGPGREAALAKHLRRIAPSATPNRLVVALADRLLERDGAMISAIAALGRGAEAFEGSLVDWRPEFPAAPAAPKTRSPA